MRVQVAARPTAPDSGHPRIEQVRVTPGGEWQNIAHAGHQEFTPRAAHVDRQMRVWVTYFVPGSSGREGLVSAPTGRVVGAATPTAVGELDINDDGALTAADAAVLYCAIQHDALLGSGAPDDPRGSAESRAAYLAPYLVAGEPVGDAALRELLAKANELMAYDTNKALDVNRDGQIRADDARIVYHALAFPDLLGPKFDTLGVISPPVPFATLAIATTARHTRL